MLDPMVESPCSDIDPQTGELWGNYPQTYSLVGTINCAVLLSKPWNSVR